MWGDVKTVNITNPTLAIDIKVLEGLSENHKFSFRMTWENFDGTTSENVSYDLKITENWTAYWSSSHNQFSGLKYVGKTDNGYDRLVISLNYLVSDGTTGSNTPGTCKKIISIQNTRSTEFSCIMDIILDEYIPFEVKNFVAGTNFSWLAPAEMSTCSKVYFTMRITDVHEEATDKRAALALLANWTVKYNYKNIPYNLTLTLEGVDITDLGSGWELFVLTLMK